MINDNAKTNGRNRKHVDALYSRVRAAIDASYLTGERYPNGGRKTVDHSDERAALRDYVTNQSWSDNFEALIKREAEHERDHRKFKPASLPRTPISVEQAATVLVLNNIGDGARLDAMPLATGFISMRDTAAEAQLIGYLARAALRADVGLLDALVALDYAGAVAA